MVRELSQLFKSLSDPTRLRIVQMLLKDGKEAFGGQLAGALGIPAYRLSRHLKVLKTVGLIRERRQGRLVYYSLAEQPERKISALRALFPDGASGPANGHGDRAPNVSLTGATS